MHPTQNEGGQAISKRQLALSWCEDELISVFKQTPRSKPNGFDVTGFVFPLTQPVAYVKFGFASERMAETRNQTYAFGALKAMPLDQTRGILIPEIYRTFESDRRFFIVMEYIPGRTLAQLQDHQDWESQMATAVDSLARAIRLLMSMQAPPGQQPGPVGGGRLQHPLFKNGHAFREYSSVDELETHLNTACDHKSLLSTKTIRF
ncbi:unnamed protein product [Discula destructiva]